MGSRYVPILIFQSLPPPSAQGKFASGTSLVMIKITRRSLVLSAGRKDKKRVQGVAIALEYEYDLRAKK